VTFKSGDLMKNTFFTKRVGMRGFLGGMTFLVVCGSAAVASAQTRTLRIVTYNVQADVSYGSTPLAGLICPFSGTGTFTTSCSGSVTNGGVLEGIGEEVVAGDPAQPIDILALQETTNNAVTVQPIVDGLNAFYSSRGISARYAMSPLQLTSTGGSGGGPSALVYNTNTVQLLESVGVGTPSGSSEARQVGRYLFAPAAVATNASNVFYVYVSHYKSGTDSTSLARRGKEAGIIRTNSASLPANSRVLYVGDYNVSTSTETSYQAMVHSTICPIGVQGFDPFNLSGASGIDWTQNSLLNQKTESVRSLHYRDDFQLMSSNVYYGVPGGLTYVSGAYHTFGNNGSVPYTSSVINGNTSLNGNLQASPPISAAQCYTNLYGASDHYPVVVDYTIPLGTTAAPTASFTASSTNGVAPLNVAFTDTSTGSPTSWAWTFGDTGTSTSENPSHTYTTPGTYTVTLIASNGGGSSTNTQTNLITVVPPPPVASFTVSPTNGAAPLTVNFTDQSSGSITGWAWAFGDGNTSISQNPSDIYVNPGSYTVREIAYGQGGSSTNTQTALIGVYDRFAWWQLQYFGSTNSSASTVAGGDYTGTGMSNTNKFLAGFNPTNPAAYLHVMSIVEESGAGGTNVVVTYLGPNGDNTYVPGIASRTNVLDYMTGDISGNYTNGGWQDTGQTNILGGGNGSGILTNMTDTAIPSAPTNRYYRVRVLLP
jgi:PKD repeat protein